MEAKKCSVDGCKEIGSICCSGNGHDLGFCRVHFESHTDEPGCHSLYEIQLTKKNHLEYYSLNAQNSENIPQVCYVFDSAYFIDINTVSLQLPEDFKIAVDGMIDMFARTICTMINYNEANIMEESENFVSALKKLVFNLRIPLLDIDRIAREACEKVFNDLKQWILDMLADFLVSAEKAYAMPSTISKVFTKNLQLEETKNNFIAKYYDIGKLEFPTFINDFSVVFKEFLKAEIDYSQEFNNLQKMYESYKDQIIKDQKQIMVQKLSALFNDLEFKRIGVFSLKIARINEIQTPENWMMFLGTIIQNDQCGLGKVVSIAEDKLLVPLHFRDINMILYYSNEETSIAGTIHSTDYLIAEGSTENNILTFCNKSNSLLMYTLNLTRLRKLENTISLGLKTLDKVESLLYLSGLNKCIYITYSNNLFSKPLDSDIRAEHILMLEGEIMNSMTFNRNREAICIKTQNFILIFNLFMQLTNRIKIEGERLIAISTEKIENEEFTFFHNRILKKFSFGTWSLEKKKSVPNKFKQCSQCLRHETMSMPNNSSYANYYSQYFLTPDRVSEFLSAYNPDDVRPSNINLVFASCESVCPGCRCSCNKISNHSDAHKAFMHLKRENGELCTEWAN